MKKHILENATVWRGEALAVLKRLKSKSVQCIVTSPPYFGLRRYLFDGAVVPRYDLSKKELAHVKKELKKAGILPRQ